MIDIFPCLCLNYFMITLTSSPPPTFCQSSGVSFVGHSFHSEEHFCAVHIAVSWYRGIPRSGQSGL